MRINPYSLRNPKWVDPIKAVLQVIGVVPGYKELDVSMVFLLFLNIFLPFLLVMRLWALVYCVNFSRTA